MKTKTYILLCVTVLFCTGISTGQTDTAAENIEKAPTPQAAQQYSGEVMARINGQPIYMDQLVDILIDGYAMPVAQQIISTELVRQNAGKKGINVSEQEIKAEHEETLRLTFPTAQNDEERDQMFQRLLQSHNLTRKTWDLVMVRNALLRKMVPQETEVPKAAVDEEIERQFGRKVVVRHIEVASLQQAQNVQIMAKKADFETIAEQFSLNPSRQNGGLLPPIGKETLQVSPALREVALAMKEPGDISDPVQVGDKFHILKLEKIIPPQEVSDESIRKDIVEKLKQVKLRNDCNRLLQDTLKSANIEFVNPLLKQQSQQISK